ncbi:luciferase [Rhizobium sp. Leaf371]|uniref:MupA/Atu3671 family FMN-dependent luciferase-like monooxygenase n=1 Tax=Rhizobium sp. Leaf371 TaxID=1736355 RepID=UPI000712CFBC|nr:MupA/Atu3671 family FMN-dependent luciferase-like monooxygenase [Rhizobium sp. Leaf371]KQS61263.1 luciferase [Rhizobium sp. Leaf371]
MTRVDCALIGDELLLVQCAEILLGRGHAIAVITTANPRVRDWAERQAIRTIDPTHGFAEALAGLDYGWLFSIANLRVIPEAVWRKARSGAINFHDAPLPARAGLNTPSWAILEDEPRHGVTWHAITSGIDEGDVYAAETFEISADETALTLNSKCFEAGIKSFATVLQQIEQDMLRPQPQDISQRRYYGRNRRPSAAATLRFDQSADALSRIVRALDFGAGYVNPLALPKIRTGSGLFAVTRFEILSHLPSEPAGLVMTVGPQGVTIGTGDRPVLVEGATLAAGRDDKLSDVLRPGMVLPLMSEEEAQSLSEAVEAIARHEPGWRRQLLEIIDIETDGIRMAEDGRAADIQVLTLNLPAAMMPGDAASVIGAFLARLSGQTAFDIAYRGPALQTLQDSHPGFFTAAVPLRISAPEDAPVTDLAHQIRTSRDRLATAGAFAIDLVQRVPGLRHPILSFGLAEIEPAAAVTPIEACAVTFVVSEGTLRLLHDRNRVSDATAAQLAARFAIFAEAFEGSTGPVGALPLMSKEEQHEIVTRWNRTERDYDRDVCVHHLIERQVDAQPDAEAIAFRGRSLTFRQMDQRANRIAHALAACGVGPDVLVGLHVSRSLDLVVAALAVLKAGGAYVPLDPDFPIERLADMVEDSKAKVILTERSVAGTFSDALTPERHKTLFIEDCLAERQETGDDGRLASGVTAGDLAYVIYTSGSTGKPKGVMVEHRNVVNFFAGMDDVIPRSGRDRDVWLAVTSLSFDISVLELFWTLATGFKVVVHANRRQKGTAAKTRRSRAGRPLDFGLFYWGHDAGVDGERYRLLLEGSKFADRNGFQSVWTPERHFHAFGGSYPNPAVTGAAVAAVTENLSIRAGSCVFPLHHPARIAEDWAVVDNLSRGRVALAAASGWMPEDFVLRPENAPPHNKAALLRSIDEVRRLWRGESVEFPLGDTKVAVTTHPRPLQKELPVWLTTAGNPESYREAARVGANVLTHLLGQTVEELADKIVIYREELVKSGRNPDDYKVTLMLHTLLGEDREEVRAQARQPMKDYLRSAAALIKQYAWAFPAFKKPQGVSQPADIDLQSVSPDELDAILEFAFLRYFEDSGLFGTVDDALLRIDQLLAIGVDDIACLVDFGVEQQVVLDRLQPLAALVSIVRGAAQEDDIGEGFAAEIAAHAVTHMQCTPSMARMFLMSEEDRTAFASLRHLFIGGEALKGSLLRDLAAETDAPVINMYGPTETTIWSSTFPAAATQETVPLGHPIANTQLYVLDAARQPVPAGTAGELYIGGDGVTRGYLNREALTGERFLSNPFEKGRIYRTGDLVRFAEDGVLHFIGRVDHQVKVRGYRIELGEIEAQIGLFPGVLETVVVTREDTADDVRIVAYMRTSVPIADAALRAHLARTQPDYMIPAHFVTLDAFPLTPNAKIDRKRLPKPDIAQTPAIADRFVPPADGLQQAIAEIFRRALNIERVGTTDSFFKLGGHSLLAIKVHRELKAGVAPDLTITDLFRFPTVAALAEHIGDRGEKTNERLGEAASRAARRRMAFGGAAGRSHVRDLV